MAGQAGNSANLIISSHVTTQVAKTTPVAKQKPAPKPVFKAAEGLEKLSAKPTQANESSDGIVSQNNSSCNERGYSIFVSDLPWSANTETVKEEFKRFGTTKPGGVQVRHSKKAHFVFGFVEYETQHSMQAAIEASPIHMEEKEVCIEVKTSNRRGPPTKQVARTAPVDKQKTAPKPVFKAAEGSEKLSAKPIQGNESSDGVVSRNNSSCNEQGYSIYVSDLPWSANIETVKEEFKRFGTIKPGGVQVRHSKKAHFVFGFVEYETQQSMQAAIEASPIHMEEKEVRIKVKTSNRRGGCFQSGRGVYRGDNFRGCVGGYVDNANYRGGDNFNRRNEGEGYNRRKEGEFYDRRNECVDPLVSGFVFMSFGRSDGDNYSRRNEGENFNHRNDGENYNRSRWNEGENFNRRNDGENYYRRKPWWREL